MMIYCELLSSLTCRWSSSTNVNVLLEFPASSRHLRVNFYCKCSADSEKCSVIIILESPFSAALLMPLQGIVEKIYNGLCI